MSIEIRAIASKGDSKKFIDFPWQIYDRQSAWVPPLKTSVYDVLDQEHNPFYRHAKIQCYLAIQNGVIVGRVAGIIDDRHNELHEEKTAFFGFFECRNDQQVATALLDEVIDWSRGRGMTTLRGPMNPSINHECGLLIEGYDLPPRIMMPYNPAYYETLLENTGLVKAKDLFAWDVEAERSFSERTQRVAERQMRRGGITIRPVRMARFDQEVRAIREIYNSAWEKNWGFVPIDKSEFEHLAKNLKRIVWPEHCLLAEVDGEPIAFGLGLPNINQVLKKIPTGELFPFGFIKLLWYLKGPGRKHITESRIITLGIKREYQKRAIGPLLYMEYLRRHREAGLLRTEASWILEDNYEMNSALEGVRAELTRRYRIYEKPLAT